MPTSLPPRGFGSTPACHSPAPGLCTGETVRRPSLRSSMGPPHHTIRIVRIHTYIHAYMGREAASGELEWRPRSATRLDASGCAGWKLAPDGPRGVHRVRGAPGHRVAPELILRTSGFGLGTDFEFRPIQAQSPRYCLFSCRASLEMDSLLLLLLLLLRVSFFFGLLAATSRPHRGRVPSRLRSARLAAVSESLLKKACLEKIFLSPLLSSVVCGCLELTKDCFCLTSFIYCSKIQNSKFKIQNSKFRIQKFKIEK